VIEARRKISRKLGKINKLADKGIRGSGDPSRKHPTPGRRIKQRPPTPRTRPHLDEERSGERPEWARVMAHPNGSKTWHVRERGQGPSKKADQLVGRRSIIHSSPGACEGGRAGTATGKRLPAHPRTMLVA